ncbi:MAG: hypothetical protein ACKVQW_01535 [Pyrinomonadaceae bacterium]
MRLLTLATALFFIFSMTAFGQARSRETLTLGVGKQKTAKKSRLKIKFLEVTEDSRCPTGVDCIWAGNAKVKVQIIGARRSQIFEFNTNLGPKGDIFDGWAITIDNLTPYPHADRPVDKKHYKVKFTIERPSR